MKVVPRNENIYDNPIGCLRYEGIFSQQNMDVGQTTQQ